VFGTYTLELLPMLGTQQQKSNLTIELLSAERKGFKSHHIINTDKQLITKTKETNSAKTLPISEIDSIFDNMQGKYTNPEIKRGKPASEIPKGSTKKREQAKQTWYISFQAYDPVSKSMKRKRITDNLNRIKDADEKEEHAQLLCQIVKENLEAGWNPFDEIGNENLRKSAINISMEDAVIAFVESHKTKGSRKKTVQSYESKLKYISQYFGKKKVNDIQDNEIIKFMHETANTNNWSPKTFNNAKAIYYGLYEYLKLEKYIAINHFSAISTKTVPKTERHKVFTDEDFKIIMEAVDRDKLLALFTRSIYYTCIRPGELLQLKRKHFDFTKDQIHVPAYISKNKKDGYVHITPEYKKLLMPFKDIDEEYHLFCNDECLYGTTPIYPTRPYKRFIRILEKLKMDKKGYTIYSFKHFSNVKKFLAGWSVAEIMKANRHASIEETENYLKDLMDFVDITTKPIPTI